MRILALQTDRDKLIKKFCHENSGERMVLMTYYHGLSFMFAIVREIFLTVVVFGAGITAWAFGLPMAWVTGILAGLWFVFVFFNVIKAYIDWYYDFILITTDKVILVDQTSIFKQEVMPIHIENIGGVSVFTQFWSIFPFGGICIHLKEGRGGEDISKKYVPNAQEVASKISSVITAYQRHQYKGTEIPHVPSQTPNIPTPTNPPAPPASAVQ